MEIEGEDGTKLSLNPGVKTLFGRGAGFNTGDLTVSRRHVSLELKPAAAGTGFADRVSFEVLGRNPVWVRVGENIRTFRISDTGEISAGDRFCVSGHFPNWFNLKRRDDVTEERVSEGGLDSIDFSDIDPLKEFGFLVIGKEFDQYPKSRMRDIMQWEWFLEDSTNGNSDDEDDDGDKKGRKGLSKKRSRKKGNKGDEDWSVDCEEDKDLMGKSKRVVSPIYSTRSKKSKKDTHASSSSSSHAQTKPRERVDVEDDEDDETLGGFIVSDEENKLEEDDELNTDDEEEEEEEDCNDDEDEE